MMEDLHNMADNILGINNYMPNEYIYVLTVISNYKIILKDLRDRDIQPIKISRDGVYTYNLHRDLYILKCVDEDNNQKYYEEIYVAKEMIGTIRTIEVK